jgi:hypothetical protein
MTVQIKWENPTKAVRGSVKGRKWAHVKVALLENPGKWALIKTSNKKVTPPEEFLGKDFQRSYRTEDGIHRVYVRYVGNNNE